MIKINKHETKQFITTDPTKLIGFIQEYQSKIRYLVFTGKIDRNYVVFSNIGIAE